MNRRDEAAATLAQMRATQLARWHRWRDRAAVVVGGLALDADHVRALKLIQRATKAPTRAAAIRAAIVLAAESIDRSRRHE